MNEKLMEIAYERGLEVVETTQGMNGYPHGLGKAVIGFETFEEAQEVARESGGEVVDLSRRDGWQFWKNNGRVWKEWKMQAEDYGDDYECVRNAAEWWQDEKGVMDSLEFGSPAEMREYLEKIEAVYDEIESLGDNEQLLICRDGSYSHEVIPVKTLRYHIDVWSHEIAVV